MLADIIKTKISITSSGYSSRSIKNKQINKKQVVQPAWVCVQGRCSIKTPKRKKMTTMQFTNGSKLMSFWEGNSPHRKIFWSLCSSTKNSGYAPEPALIIHSTKRLQIWNYSKQSWKNSRRNKWCYFSTSVGCEVSSSWQVNYIFWSIYIKFISFFNYKYIIIWSWPSNFHSDKM